MNNKKNICKIGFIILTYIVLIGIIIALSIYISKLNNDNLTKEEKLESVQNKDEDIYKKIRLNEDLSTDGEVENLENVRWRDARIMQNDDKLELSIMLNNELKDKKIEAKTLTVKLLDKQGKEIATKDFEMKEIPDNYGYTNIELTFDTPEPIIVYDIVISAK